MTLGSFRQIFAFQGMHEQSAAYTQEAIRLAQRLKNPWAKAMSLHLSGWFDRAKNNSAEALAAFSEAARLFEAVRDTSFAFISLSEAGHIKRLSKDFTGAEAIYRQTILFFQEAEGKSAVIHQLECFGICAAFQDQYPRAATLLGATQAHRASEVSTRMPNEQAEFDEALAYLANAMVETELAAAMDEGSRMSIDEAVDFALDEPEDPEDQSPV
jgi:hypothetical protein